MYECLGLVDVFVPIPPIEKSLESTWIDPKRHLFSSEHHHYHRHRARPFQVHGKHIKKKIIHEKLPAEIRRRPAAHLNRTRIPKCKLFRSISWLDCALREKERSFSPRFLLILLLLLSQADKWKMESIFWLITFFLGGVGRTGCPSENETKKAYRGRRPGPGFRLPTHDELLAKLPGSDLRTSPTLNTAR